MSRYLICGLSVTAALPLPGVARVAEDSSAVDVTVRCGEVPQTLENPNFVGPTWQVAGQRFVLDLPGILRMLVEDGRNIVVSPAAGMTETDIAPFVLSTGFGAILHQRGVLALHAATVVSAGRGIALCGASGAGKSTLAAALCHEGNAFVGDDIAAIRFDAAGPPVVFPDGRQHRLWADAITRLDLAPRQGQPIREHLPKFHVRLPMSKDEPQPVALTTVVILRARPAGEPEAPAQIVQLSPVDAAPLLRPQVFRPVLAHHMGLDGQLFGQIVGLLGQVRVFTLERSLGFEHLADTVAAMRAAVAEAS